MGSWWHTGRCGRRGSEERFLSAQADAFTPQNIRGRQEVNAKKRRRPASFGMTVGCLKLTNDEVTACFVRSDVGCLKSRMKRPTGFAGLKPSAYIGERGLEDGPERF